MKDVHPINYSRFFYSKERKTIKNRITLPKIFGNSSTSERYAVIQIIFQDCDVKVVSTLYK